MRTGARRMNLDVVLTEEQQAYLDVCASVRQMSTRRMLTKIVEAIARDQLVTATLDDDGKPAPRVKGQHAPSIRQTSRAPNFGTVATEPRRASRPPPPPPPPTRGEMRDELRRAVEHTQAMTPSDEDVAQ